MLDEIQQAGDLDLAARWLEIRNSHLADTDAANIRYQMLTREAKDQLQRTLLEARRQQREDMAALLIEHARRAERRLQAAETE